MSIKEEMTKVESPGKSIRFTERLKSLSVRWKIRIAYWAGIILTASLVIIMVHLFQRREAIHHAYDKVNLLRSVKTKLAETWFERLADNITNMASDEKTLEVQGQLTESFLNIENDNYSTQGAETPDKIRSLLEGYYTTEVIPVLENKTGRNVTLRSVLPVDNKQIIFQYLYIAANTKPTGSKLGMNKAPDESSYSTLHALVQPGMVKFARETGISDIFFVDYKTGYVVYSLQKNPDFATSLYDGPYHNTGLGMAFKAAIGLPQGSYQITDESLYAGALLKPALFISAPLFVGNEIKGAVILSVNISSLDRLLAMDKDDEANIPGLKSFFVGPDLLYRNDDPSLSLESKKYIRRLKRQADDGTTYTQVEKLNTTAMIQRVNSLAFADGIAGKEKLGEYRTETGEQVLSSYGPVAIPGLKWMLVSQLDKFQALRPVRSQVGYLIIISFILALLGYIFVHIVSDRLAVRLAELGGFLQKGIHSGKSAVLLKSSQDEIETAVSAAQLLKERIYDASNYTDQLGSGNLDAQLTLDDEEDKLGSSLNNLKNILVNRREEEVTRIREDEIRNWSTHGVALFNDILRMDNDNLEKLCLNIIRNIIQYLSANQGGIFLLDKEEESDFLNLVAAYAFDRQKFLKKRIRVGEGLAGTCALEKKTVLLGKIPDNYMEITSGLGGAKPSCLLIVPLKKEEEVLGVMEIASFNPFKPHEVEFVEKVAESIASALITVRLHLQTSQYLERFQQQSEEMKAQDEELRQNIEELQATHEQMERMKSEEDARNQKMMKEIEDQRKLLLQILDQIPGKIFLKDHNGVMLLLNSAVAKVYGKTVEELIGTTDFDNHSPEDARVYREKELEILANGAETYIQEESITGENKFLKTTKMPFYIPSLDKVGLLGIQLDVTDVKQKELEAVSLSEEIKAHDEELRQNIEELHATQEQMERMKTEEDARNKKRIQEMEDQRKLLISILNEIPEKIFLKDDKGRFIIANNLVAANYNRPVEEILGKSDFDFYPREEAEKYFQTEQEIIRAGKTQSFEEGDVERYDKLVVRSIKKPFYVEHLGITGLFGVQFDISDIKRKEFEAVKMAEEITNKQEEIERYAAEMQKEKALLDALLNNVPEHIYFKDKESKFLRFSKSMLKLFGLQKAEDLTGKSDFDFFDDAHARPAYDGEQEIIRTGKAIIDLEEREVMDDGRVNWVNTTKMPLRNVHGEIIGTFGISKDISKLKKLEEEANKKMKNEK